MAVVFFHENLSLLKSIFFSHTALIHDSCVCGVCCVCVCVCVCGGGGVFMLYASNFENMCI